MFKRMSVLEKKKIYDDFLKSQGIFLIKAETDEVIQAQVKRIEPKVAICSLNTPLKEIPKETRVVVNFAVEDERYFIQTEMNLRGEQIFLDITADLFLLQRRKTVRLEIPPQMKAKMAIISYQGKVVYFEARVLDYSAGGARVSYATADPHFRVNEKMKVIFSFEGRQPFEVEGVVRHTFAKGDIPEVPQIFGIQFETGKGILQSKLAIVFMDLQREIFNKYRAAD
ncbi:MAG: PilZ domain-containing protein [Bdellovibrionota bacterium]